MITYIKKHYVISIIVGLVLVVLLGWGIFGSKTQKDIVTVTKKDLIQGVLVTGKTKAAESVELAFEKSSKVIRANSAVGSRVVVGQVLAELDSSELVANLMKAKAQLAQEKANAVNTDISVNDAIADVQAKILDAYSRSDDSVRNLTDQFFNGPRNGHAIFQILSDDGQTVLTSTALDSNLLFDLHTQRNDVETLLVSWEKSIQSPINSTNSELYATQASENLKKVQKFLDTVALGINSISVSGLSGQATLAGYKATVGTARSNVSTGLINLNEAIKKLNTAKADQVTSSSNNSGAITLQDSKILQIEADIQNINAQIAKTVLRSPLTGIVTKQDAKVGQIVGAGEKVVSVISDTNFEIEANVSEVNIGKVSVGNTAHITFDAFPGETFTGKVIYIDPAETLIDNVVNYKVTFTFDKNYPNIKSGLTANLSVETARKGSVLSVPQYAVIKEGTSSYVTKTVNGKPTKTEVTLGIVGEDGNVEVLSGLSEGDTVEVNIKK